MPADLIPLAPSTSVPRGQTRGGADRVSQRINLPYGLSSNSACSNSLVTTFATRFVSDRRGGFSPAPRRWGREGVQATRRPRRRNRVGEGADIQWVRQGVSRCLPLLNRGTFRGPLGEFAGTQAAPMPADPARFAKTKHKHGRGAMTRGEWAVHVMSDVS